MSITVFAPGRTELAGNHTDHQQGRILASAVSMGITAKCDVVSGNVIHVVSEGFPSFEVRLTQLKPVPKEFGKSQGLVRGMVSVFKELGLKVGAFDAAITSTLPSGSGLSSSAAFAVLIGRVLSELFNDGKVSPIVIARAAKRAENEFFGKPCGLMDQLVCALGECLFVDFKESSIQPITADFGAMGLALCLTETGGSHAGLDSSYARIPADMVRIANMFDKGVLGDVDPAEFRAKGWSKEDRPVRRAYHFFDENERVVRMKEALLAKDGAEYMRLMNESGRSSEELLNNIVTSATGDTRLAEGLELSKKLLEGKGAWRVHGGGFAGCVQALMPIDYYETYKTAMEKEFGAGTCLKISLA